LSDICARAGSGAGAFDITVDVNDPATLPARAQMSLNLLEQVVEPGDGLALAGSADMTKDVLFLEAFADEVVSNPATEALAHAWGATQVTLAMRSRATTRVTLPSVAAPFTGTPLHALVQLDPASHQMFTAQSGEHRWQAQFPPFVKQDPPIVFDNPIEIAHSLALLFIDSVLAGPPSVSDPTR
jgi:hypothetical protein